MPVKTRQQGAALLMAMLTVALVATLAAGALWQQWRSVEIEASERSRVQAGWILSGALDWARLILREDARSGAVDHLGEPWSIGLSESRLSTFLAMDRSNTDLEDDVFLSGQITDAQARMNVMNLIVGGKVSEPDLKAFARLFDLLGLDPAELDQMSAKLLLAVGTGSGAMATAGALAANAAADDVTPLLPRRVEQLRWLGLSAASLRELEPHITVLPAHTPLNLNTAGAEALSASIPMSLVDARRMVTERERKPYQNLAEAGRAIAAAPGALNTNQLSVSTRFFEVRGRLRMEQTVVEERSLVQRNGMDVTVLWRERSALSPPSAPPGRQAGSAGDTLLTMRR
jgi:general secretion pathway protein K